MSGNRAAASVLLAADEPTTVAEAALALRAGLAARTRRTAAVIDKQRKRATELDLDDDQAALIWSTLIDWNINYEKGIIAARKRLE